VVIFHGHLNLPEGNFPVCFALSLLKPQDTMGKLKRKEKHEAELSQLEKDIATWLAWDLLDLRFFRGKLQES
jgi:hypothetical protein